MKRRGIGIWWWLLMTAVFVSCAVGAAWRFVPPSDDFLWSRTSFPKPSYRAIAQLHVAFQDVRADLLLIEAGAAVPHEEVSRHVDILASKINVLTRPSELRELYAAVQGFKEGTARLSALPTSALPELASANFSREAVQAALPVFNRLYPTILDLSNNAWLQGNRDREDALESIDWQRTAVSGVMTFLTLALVGVVILLGRTKRALGSA